MPRQRELAARASRNSQHAPTRALSTSSQHELARARSTSQLEPSQHELAASSSTEPGSPHSSLAMHRSRPLSLATGRPMAPLPHWAEVQSSSRAAAERTATILYAQRHNRALNKATICSTQKTSPPWTFTDPPTLWSIPFTSVYISFMVLRAGSWEDIAMATARRTSFSTPYVYSWLAYD